MSFEDANSNLQNVNNIIVSNDPQANATTAATLDTNYSWAQTYIRPQAIGTRDNRAEAKGYEEPTKMMKAGWIFNYTLSAPMVCIDQLIWMAIMAHGGVVTPTFVDVAEKAVQYVIPVTTNLIRVLPYFTSGGRLGETMEKLQSIGNVFSTFGINIGAAMDSYITAAGNVMGIGYFHSDPLREVVADVAKDAVSTDVSEAIYDDTVDSVHSILYDYNDDGKYCMDVRDRVETITDQTITWKAGGPYPAGAGSHDLKVIFRRQSVEDNWGSTLDIAPDLDYNVFLRSSLMACQMNGYLSGPATAPVWNPGIDIDCELVTLATHLDNRPKPIVCTSSIDPLRKRHDAIRRGAKTQNITVNRRMIDALFTTMGRELDRTSLMVKFGGEIIEDVLSTREQFILLYPNLQFPPPETTTSDDENAETANMTVEEDTTGTYPTCIAIGITGTNGIGGYSAS